MKKERKKDSPSNLKEGDCIKGLLYKLLHCHSCGQPGCCAVSKLSCAPILLDKVQLAVILRVEVTQVATLLNKFL
jgi:hypothetical protein